MTTIALIVALLLLSVIIFFGIATFRMGVRNAYDSRSIKVGFITASYDDVLPILDIRDRAGLKRVAELNPNVKFIPFHSNFNILESAWDISRLEEFLEHYDRIIAKGFRLRDGRFWRRDMGWRFEQFLIPEALEILGD